MCIRDRFWGGLQWMGDKCGGPHRFYGPQRNFSVGSLEYLVQPTKNIYTNKKNNCYHYLSSIAVSYTHLDVYKRQPL